MKISSYLGTRIPKSLSPGAKNFKYLVLKTCLNFMFSSNFISKEILLLLYYLYFTSLQIAFGYIYFPFTGPFFQKCLRTFTRLIRQWSIWGARLLPPRLPRRQNNFLTNCRNWTDLLSQRLVRNISIIDQINSFRLHSIRIGLMKANDGSRPGPMVLNRTHRSHRAVPSLHRQDCKTCRHSGVGRPGSHIGEPLCLN